eukprot:3536025-Pleurochrysis_carterae.AAC.2
MTATKRRGYVTLLLRTRACKAPAFTQNLVQWPLCRQLLPTRNHRWRTRVGRISRNLTRLIEIGVFGIRWIVRAEERRDSRSQESDNADAEQVEEVRATDRKGCVGWQSAGEEAAADRLCLGLRLDVLFGLDQHACRDWRVRRRSGIKLRLQLRFSVWLWVRSRAMTRVGVGPRKQYDQN